MPMTTPQRYIENLPYDVLQHWIAALANNPSRRAQAFHKACMAELSRRQNPAPLFQPSDSYNPATVLDEERATMPQPGKGLPAHSERTQTRPAASDDFQAIPAAHRPAESFPCGEY